MPINRYHISIAIGICLTTIGAVIFFSPAAIPFSPLGSGPTQVANQPVNNYIILGFVPYWNLKKLSPIAMESITNIAYFNLHLDKNGDIYTMVNRREEDPSYTNYKRILNHVIDLGDKPLTITFMPIDQEALISLLSSPTNRSAAITNIVNTLTESHASGVNIDFEPLGDIPPSLRDAFTSFMQELHTELAQQDTIKLTTISIYPSAVSKPRIWDLAALAPLANDFVVMTYDYTMPITDNAGPNAPLRGSNQLFDNDVIKNIAEITNLVPPGKILLGIPFYGYEWRTVDDTKYSPTLGRGTVASLERIQAMLDDQTLKLLWDHNTLTPYGIASVSGQTSQIYFENEASIGLKLEFVKASHLGGIAIWALGYEGEDPSLWNSITTALSSRP